MRFLDASLMFDYLGARPRGFHVLSWSEKRIDFADRAIAFLKATIAYYERLGIKVERIMTDNGSCYRSKAFKKALKAFGLRQIFTRPYTPKTNGKAERFIQTSLREWAYAMAYENSLQRQAQLAVWLHRYNWHRPHASLRAKPPVTRLGLSMDNLLRLHI
jgi:transposase InsO family protein